MLTSDEQVLSAYLRDRDAECPGCGYNLRNLTSTFCPECGQQIELAIRLAQPRQIALIAGLVGLSAGCGLGGLLLIYAGIVEFFMHRSGSFFDRFVLVNGIGFISHGIVLLLWVKNWNRIRRAKEKFRRILVLICWLMPLTFIVLFAAYI